MTPQHPHIPETMLAMILEAPGKPLVLRNLPMPVPSAGQVLVKVIACGVSRTDVQIVDGKLQHARLPLIPGHEIIGAVVAKGAAVQRLAEGDLIGVSSYTVNGGYATFTVVPEQYCLLLPGLYANASGVPLLRSLADLSPENVRLLLQQAALAPLHTTIQVFELHQANEALQLLRSGDTEGAAVLVMPLEE